MFGFWEISRDRSRCPTLGCLCDRLRVVRRMLYRFFSYPSFLFRFSAVSAGPFCDVPTVVGTATPPPSLGFSCVVRTCRFFGRGFRHSLLYYLFSDFAVSGFAYSIACSEIIALSCGEMRRCVSASSDYARPFLFFDLPDSLPTRTQAYTSSRSSLNKKLPMSYALLRYGVNPHPSLVLPQYGGYFQL